MKYQLNKAISSIFHKGKIILEVLQMLFEILIEINLKN